MVEETENLFGKIEFRGQPAFVCEGRLKPAVFEQIECAGYKIYGIRHVEGDFGLPDSVSPVAFCNYYGAMITEKELVFDGNYKNIQLTPEEAEAIIKGVGNIDDTPQYTWDELMYPNRYLSVLRPLGFWYVPKDREGNTIPHKIVRPMKEDENYTGWVIHDVVITAEPLPKEDVVHYSFVDVNAEKRKNAMVEKVEQEIPTDSYRRDCLIRDICRGDISTDTQLQNGIELVKEMNRA